MTAGRRRAARPGPAPQRLLGLLLAAVVAGAAWWFLVRAAVDFGRSAADGDGAARWAFTLVAGVGAALCLTLVFLLLVRIWEERAPRGPVGGRRRR
jgi:hypothetical protein